MLVSGCPGKSRCCPGHVSRAVSRGSGRTPGHAPRGNRGTPPDTRDTPNTPNTPRHRGTHRDTPRHKILPRDTGTHVLIVQTCKVPLSPLKAGRPLGRKGSEKFGGPCRGPWQPEGPLRGLWSLLNEKSACPDVRKISHPEALKAPGRPLEASGRPRGSPNGPAQQNDFEDGVLRFKVWGTT